ncbi:MAG: AI-2E family transporter [Candidatus Eremiobacteraeota bacterium]|nr:AI-2E family transporter [Candidatus Eremiobacteraeota bacterium]
MDAHSLDAIIETRRLLDVRVTFWLKCAALLVLLWIVLEHVVGYFANVGFAAVVGIGGVFLAYVFYPMVHRLNERLPLWASVSIVYLGFATVAALALSYVVPLVAADFQTLVSSVPKFEQQAISVINDPRTPILSRLPPAVHKALESAPNQLGTYMQRDAAALMGNLLGAMLSLLTLGAIFIAVPVVSIYMLLEAETIKRTFLGMLPSKRRDRAKSVLSELDEVVGGFVRGQFLIALSVGIMVTALLVAFRLPYALLIGVWAGIVDVVPYLGAVAGAIPALLIALTSGSVGEAALLMLGFCAINQIEGSLLAPRIVSKTVRVSPLAVIFALLIGGELFGVVGMLVAVPIAGAVRVLIDNVRPPESLTNAEVEPGLTKAPQSEVSPLSTTSDVTVSDVEKAMEELGDPA